VLLAFFVVELAVRIHLVKIQIFFRHGCDVTANHPFRYCQTPIALPVALPALNWFHHGTLCKPYTQVSSAAPMSGRASVHEDWALVAVAAGGGWGEDWSGSSWLIPIASVVPVSL
jgi:hypothetical protein